MPNHSSRVVVSSCQRSTVLAFVVASLAIVLVSVPWFHQLHHLHHPTMPVVQQQPKQHHENIHNDNTIPPIPRVLESSLQPMTLVDEYIRPGIPVILIRDETRGWVGEITIVRDCGTHMFNAIPPSLVELLDQLSPFQTKYVLHPLAWFALGVHVPTWLDERRRVSLARIVRFRRSIPTVLQEQWPRSYWRKQQLLPQVWVRILDILAVPQIWLEHAPLDPELAFQCGFHTSGTKHEQAISSTRNRKDDSNNNPNQDRIVSLYVTSRSEEDDTSHRLYPYLHRDDNDFDVFVDVHRGCQDVVIVAAQDRHQLQHPVNGHVWKDDFWTTTIDAQTQKRPMRIWKGTVQKGETLFFPGDALHEIRSSCPGTVSVRRRPWLARGVRYVDFPVSAITTTADDSRVL